MNKSSRSIARADLNQRFPEADNSELHRLLADLILGPEFAKRVFEDPIKAAEFHCNYFEIYGRFRETELRSFISGSLASILYGMVRMAQDSDLIVELNQVYMFPLAEGIGDKSPLPNFVCYTKFWHHSLMNNN